MHIRAALILGAMVLIGSTAHGQPSARPSIGELMQALSGSFEYREVAMSPDGRFVAWVQSKPARAGAQSTSTAIYFARIEPGSVPKMIPLSAAGEAAVEAKHLAWSPDSTSLAFLSDAGSPGQSQLYVTRIADLSTRQLTHLKGNLATPRYSRDGHDLAFLLIDDAVQAAGPLAAAGARGRRWRR